MSHGPHALRATLLALRTHLRQAERKLEEATAQASDLGATDQLAIAVGALRSIANQSSSTIADNPHASKGIAAGALERMGVERVQGEVRSRIRVLP